MNGDAFVDPVALEDDHSNPALFEGDQGTLTLKQRQCLAKLLKVPILSRDQHPGEWSTLLEHAPVLRSRLNDLLLDLVIDTDRGVAIKRQVRNEASKGALLLYDAPYTREETVLAVFLRRRYRDERASGQDRVRLDRQECLNAISSYRPATATDISGDQARAAKAVESFRKNGILLKTTDKERFEISAVIEALLPVDRLTTLADELARRNSPAANGNGPTHPTGTDAAPTEDPPGGDTALFGPGTGRDLTGETWAAGTDQREDVA